MNNTVIMIQRSIVNEESEILLPDEIWIWILSFIDMYQIVCNMPSLSIVSKRFREYLFRRLDLYGYSDVISPAFPSERINFMINNLYEINTYASHLFITIDPNGGKDRSLYVLSSFVFVNDMCIVCTIYPFLSFHYELLMSISTHMIMDCCTISFIRSISLGLVTCISSSLTPISSKSSLS